MALQISGPISMGDINVELNRPRNSPISLNDPEVRTLLARSSGAINLSDAYGKVAEFTFNITSNQSNLNLRVAALNAGWNGKYKLIATVGSGVVISGSPGADALQVDGSFPNGVVLINSGLIVGAGGTGGTGGTARGDLQIANGGADGGSGWTGLAALVPLTVFNNNIIAGGGGGGGGGGSTIANQYRTSGGDKTTPGITYLDRQSVAGGGGGGGGRGNNFGTAGGAGGSAVRGQTATLSGGSLITAAQPGGNGNLNTNGSGGFRGEDLDYGDTHAIGGSGGAGGFWGAPGAPGGASEYANKGPRLSGGGAGGAGGAAVVGNSNITWGTTGQRYGAIT